MLVRPGPTMLRATISGLRRARHRVADRDHPAGVLRLDADEPRPFELEPHHLRVVLARHGWRCGWSCSGRCRARRCRSRPRCRTPATACRRAGTPPPASARRTGRTAADCRPGGASSAIDRTVGRRASARARPDCAPAAGSAAGARRLRRLVGCDLGHGGGRRRRGLRLGCDGRRGSSFGAALARRWPARLAGTVSRRGHAGERARPQRRRPAQAPAWRSIGLTSTT